MPETHMEELDKDECRKLLAERHLGRLAIPDGTVASGESAAW